MAPLAIVEGVPGIAFEQRYEDARGSYGDLCFGKNRLPCIGQPYRGNIPNVSRIRMGSSYWIRRDSTGKHQYFAIEGPLLERRTAIEIHPANWPWQLRGCFAPGLEWWTKKTGEIGVRQSARALTLLLQWWEEMGKAEGDPMPFAVREF